MKSKINDKKASPLRISAYGSLFLAISVALGAFGAHSLADILEANTRTDTYSTAMDYMFYHSLGLLAMGVIYDRLSAGRSVPSRHRSASLFIIIGIIVFSGSLIALSLTGIAWLGAITPIGGVSFIAGWVAFARDIFRLSK